MMMEPWELRKYGLAGRQKLRNLQLTRRGSSVLKEIPPIEVIEEKSGASYEIYEIFSDGSILLDYPSGSEVHTLESWEDEVDRLNGMKIPFGELKKMVRVMKLAQKAANGE